jgi:hypothetical protein
MRRHRLGPHRGFTRWAAVGWVHVLFFRRSRWVPWRPVELMRGLLAPARFRFSRQLTESLIVKAIDPMKVSKAKSHLASSIGLEKMPSIAEYLTSVTLDSAAGSVDREPPVIVIVVRDGVLQVTLKEPSQRLKLRVEVASPAAFWPTLEAALSNPSSMWEVDTFTGPARRGKRK